LIKISLQYQQALKKRKESQKNKIECLTSSYDDERFNFVNKDQIVNANCCAYGLNSSL